MSRIGKIPVEIPKGVDVKITPDTVSAKGPKGEARLEYRGHVVIRQEGSALLVERKSDENQDRAYHGLYQRTLSNLIKGVSAGFQKELELVGVGYRATMDGTTLVLSLGYSHEVRFQSENGIKLSVPKQTSVIVEGFDRQRVGQVAANIRALRPPEPYKGKGIRYVGEIVRKKVGKTGAK